MIDISVGRAVRENELGALRTIVGIHVGVSVVGMSDGVKVGHSDGMYVGTTGERVGKFRGVSVGVEVEKIDGKLEGIPEGREVGAVGVRVG
jgi:hypothetical protein